MADEDLEQCEDVFEVEKIIDVTKDESGTRMYRVRWKGFGPEEDTWEPKSNLITCEELLVRFKENRKREKLEKLERKKLREAAAASAASGSATATTASTPNLGSPTAAPAFTNVSANNTNPKTSAKSVKKKRMANLTLEIPEKAPTFDMTTPGSDIDGIDTTGMTRQEKLKLAKVLEESRKTAGLTPMDKNVNDQDKGKPANTSESSRTPKASPITSPVKKNPSSSSISHKHELVMKGIAPISPKDVSGGSTSDSEPDETTKKYLMKWGDKKYSPGKTNQPTSTKIKTSSGAVKKVLPISKNEVMSGVVNATIAGSTKITKTKVSHSTVSLQDPKTISTNKTSHSSKENSANTSSQLSKLSAKLTDAPIFTPKSDYQKNSSKSASKKLLSPPLKVAAIPPKSQLSNSNNTVKSVDKNTTSMKSGQKHGLPTESTSQKSSEKTPNFNLEALKLRLNKSKISAPKTILLSGPASSAVTTKSDSSKASMSHTPTQTQSSTHPVVTTSSVQSSDSLDISSILTGIAHAPSLQPNTSGTTSGAASLRSILSKPTNESAQDTALDSTSDIDFQTTTLKDPRAAPSSSNVEKTVPPPPEPAPPKKTKLSLQQYNKKRRASNAQADAGITLGFMKLPTISTASVTPGVTTIEANTVDPTRVILRQNSDKGKNISSEKSKNIPKEKPVRDFPQASTEDVLGNILDSMSESIESDMVRSRIKTPRSSENNTDSLPPPPPPPPIPIARPIQNILEQESGGRSPADELLDVASVSSQGSDFDTDLDDYSGDEDGLLMFADSGSNRQSHLELPNANQKTLSNAIVHAAILAGELSTVIEAYIPSNEIDELVDDTDTLLMKAVAECATEMVRVLLEKNADPNIVSRNGKTPLMYAVELNQKGIVVLLIQYGAQLNTQQSNGETALMMACKNGSIEIVHCLLNNGADVTVTHMERTLASAPKYLRQSLGLALQKHSQKLNEIMKTVLREVLPINNDVSLGSSLMECRCVLPNERDEHDFYFSCNIDYTQPKISVVLLCLPVTFEQAGKVNVKFGENDNGIDEIILNEQSMISVIPNNRYLYFLTPTKGVNELRIQTYNCGYKILTCIYVVEFGADSLKKKMMHPGMPIMGSAVHSGQPGGVMMYRSHGYR